MDLAIKNRATVPKASFDPQFLIKIATMRRFLFALISLVTITGGHFLNRRLDRGFLFFSLFLLWLIGGYLFAAFTLPSHMNNDFLGMYRQLVVAIAYGAMGLLVTSALVTFVDGNPARRSERVAISGSGRSGGFLVSLMSGWIVLAGGQATWNIATQLNAINVGQTNLTPANMHSLLRMSSMKQLTLVVGGIYRIQSPCRQVRGI